MTPELVAVLAGSPIAVGLVTGIVIAKRYMNGRPVKDFLQHSEVVLTELKTSNDGLTEAVNRNTAASERQTDVLSELVEKLIKERS